MNKRKSFVIALVAALLFSSSTLFMNTVKAEGTSPLLEYIYNKPSNEFQFNYYMLLDLYSDNSTGRGTYADYRHAMTKLADGKYVAKAGEVLIPIYDYSIQARKRLIDMENTGDTANTLQNGYITSGDSTWIKALGQVKNEGFIETITVSDLQTNWWEVAAKDIVYSLVDYLKAKGVSISDEDITLNAYVYQKAIEGYSTEDIEFTISNKTQMTEETFNKIKAMIQVNNAVEEAEYQASSTGEALGQEYIMVTATTKSGVAYRMVLGQDNNWYLLGDADETVRKLIIHYITNGGEELDPITFTIKNPDDMNQKVSLSTTTREGYEFVGWYEENELKNEVDLKTVEDVYGLENINPNDDGTYEVNVYAKWTNTTENPKTGITSLYISGGVIIAAAGLFAIARKKNLYNKI